MAIDKYKLITFGTEIGEGSADALMESNKHQKAIVNAFKSGSVNAVRFSETLKEIDALTLEWKNKILIKESDLSTALTSAQAKIGEFKSKDFDLSTLDIQDVFMVEYTGLLKDIGNITEFKKKIEKQLGEFVKLDSETFKVSMPVPEDMYEDFIKNSSFYFDKLSLPSPSLSPSLANKDLQIYKKQQSSVGQASKGTDNEEINDKPPNERRKGDSGSIIKKSLIITLLTSLVDITRRILTAVLDFGTDVKQRSEASLVVGTDYMTNRSYQVQEKAMGLPENIFMEAKQSIQSAFGNIADLDENAIAKLAPVLGNRLEKMITMGLGASNPKAIMELILDEFFKQGLAGVNSLGIQVGQVEAQRELTSALEKAGLSELAKILNNMFYTNSFGLYKGMIGTENSMQDYFSLAKNIPSGLTAFEYAHIAELEQVIENLDSKFLMLGNTIKGKLMLSLEDILNKINNLQLGMSDTDKFESGIETEGKLKNKRKERKNLLNSIINKPAVKEVLQYFGLTKEEDIIAFLENPEIHKAFLDYLDSNELQDKQSIVSDMLLASSVVKDMNKIDTELKKERSKMRYNESEYTNNALVLDMLATDNPLLAKINNWKDYPNSTDLASIALKTSARKYLGLTLAKNATDKENYQTIIDSEAYKELIKKENKTKEEEKFLVFLEDIRKAGFRTVFDKGAIKAGTMNSDISQYSKSLMIEQGNAEIQARANAQIILAEQGEAIKAQLLSGNDYISKVTYSEGEQGDTKVNLTLTVKNSDTGKEEIKTWEVQSIESGYTNAIDITDVYNAIQG